MKYDKIKVKCSCCGDYMYTLPASQLNNEPGNQVFCETCVPTDKDDEFMGQVATTSPVPQDVPVGNRIGTFNW